MGEAGIVLLLSSIEQQSIFHREEIDNLQKYQAQILCTGFVSCLLLLQFFYLKKAQS